MKQLFLWISLCLTQFLMAQNGTETIKVTDMLSISQVGNVSISPDGSKTLFSVTSIEPEGDNKWEYRYVNKLYLLNNDGSGTAKAITGGKESASQPVWSPDSKQILFVRPADGRAQLFLLSLDGGEPVQLTRFKYGAGSPRWSPDGKKIIFSVSLRLEQLLVDEELNPGKKPPSWSLEKPGFPANEFLLNNAKPDPDGNTDEIRAYLNLNAGAQKAKVINKLNFQQESTTSGELSFTHFFIINADGSGTPKAITHGFNRFNGVDFTPDGQQIILTGNAGLTEHPDRVLETEIYIANTDGSNMRKILGEKGKSYNSPAISPSGKWMAFQFGGTSFVSVPSLAIMPLNGKATDNSGNSF